MTVEDVLKTYVHDKLQAAKAVTQRLALTTSVAKAEALEQMARSLWTYRADILAANAEDVAHAEREGQPASRIDRLRLDEPRIQQMMEGLRQIRSLPDPIGELLESIVRPNGLRIDKVRVPMGVIAMIYEARPNVTVDAVGLAIKTGNTVILRGGKEALRSNSVLVAALRAGLKGANLPVDAIQFIDRDDRATVDLLVRARGLVDLAIPRGGAGLIQRVVASSLVPVIETGVGNCHVYVDRAADLTMAKNIAINAKIQRPSVCNAMETLLVHEAVASWLPDVLSELTEMGVEIHGCARTLAAVTGHGQLASIVSQATEEDWGTEYLDLTLAVKVVDDVDAAMGHIARHGTLHSESIVTEDVATAETFLAGVDAAVVYHNASTRFTDGFEFGFGAEIGISTQKLHARGPMGLKELTSYKYVVRGDGQTRS